jgi:hypothetical protein
MIMLLIRSPIWVPLGIVLYAVAPMVFWVLIAVGVVSVLGACMRAEEARNVKRILDRQRALDKTALRAEAENEYDANGDPRGLYGQFPAGRPEMSRIDDRRLLSAAYAAINAEPDESKWSTLPEVVASCKGQQWQIDGLIDQVKRDHKRKMTEWPLSGLRDEKVARVREVKKYAKARNITVGDAIVELINKGLDS